MIKYSLQNECLEMIEAFSDEQMSSDMAVIESVLDIFDKTILMMELSNEPVDIPDVSMFMESAFFQEEGNPPPADDGNTGDGEKSNPAPATDQSSNNNASSSDNNTNNNTMSEADRKAYNKEHWVRMKNKEGKLENIFISIIAFIPRLLGFIIQSIVRFFKKLTNKKSDDDIKNAQKDAETLTDEEIIEAENEAEAEIPDGEGSNESQPQPQVQQNQQTDQKQQAQQTDKNQDDSVPQQKASPNGNDNVGSMDPKTKMWSWFDEQKILEAINRITNVLSSLNIENFDSIQAFNADIKRTKQELNSAMSQRVSVDGNSLVNSKNNIMHQLNGLSDAANRTKSTLENFSKNRNLVSKALGNGAIVKETKNVVESLKEYANDFASDSKKLIKGYNKATKQAEKIRAKAAKKQGGSQQNQPQQQQPVNPVGGENQNG